MERIVKSLKIIIRSERALIERQLKIAAERLQLAALAGSIAVFGVVALDVSAFFALQPLWGSALSALAVGGANLIIAICLIAYSKNLHPGPEAEMIKEVRDLAISEIEDEVSDAKHEMIVLKDEAKSLFRNPLDALLPSMLSPLLKGIVRTAKKRSRSKGS